MTLLNRMLRVHRGLYRHRLAPKDYQDDVGAATEMHWSRSGPGLA
jgi:hypothetical protein